jgi:hypothetical protein
METLVVFAAIWPTFIVPNLDANACEAMTQKVSNAYTALAENVEKTASEEEAAEAWSFVIQCTDSSMSPADVDRLLSGLKRDLKKSQMGATKKKLDV